VALLLLVLTSRVYKWSINRITNPNSVYSHTLNCDSILQVLFSYFVCGLFNDIFSKDRIFSLVRSVSLSTAYNIPRKNFH
jgi:hypothetical protein